ncbi:MAG: diacylglycerol/lipid kinase family protein [Leptospirillum sp.]
MSHPTEWPESLRKIRIQKPDALFVGGGDGTVHHLLQMDFPQDLPLVPIPLGSANVLSYHLQGKRIPSFLYRDEPLFPVTVRLGEWNDGLFLLMAGAGFDGRAVKKIRPSVKYFLGQAGYLIAALSAMSDWSVSPFRIVLHNEGLKAEEYRTIWCVVRRMPVYFPPFPPEPSWENGRNNLRVDVFTGTTRKDLLIYLLGVASGVRGMSWYRISRWATQVDISGEIPGQMDGEPVLYKDATLSLSSRRITLLFSAKGLKRFGRFWGVRSPSSMHN